MPCQDSMQRYAGTDDMDICKVAPTDPPFMGTHFSTSEMFMAFPGLFVFSISETALG